MMAEAARIVAPQEFEAKDHNLVSEQAREGLIGIQHDLFDLGGELSSPGHRLLQSASIDRIERLASEFNHDLPPLKEFVLPGGSRSAALAHVARTVCRRAERAIIAAARTGPVTETSRIYLNRLSDLLFILARRFNRETGAGDVLWNRGTRT